jgi:hypothetical protein
MEPILRKTRRPLGLALTCLAVLTLVGAPPAHSETKFDGSKARVNLSNKLLMLSQEIGSASCRINAGLAPEQARQDLAAARQTFNTIIDGLENGGPALGIPSGENSRFVLDSIERVKQVWAPVDTAADALLSGGNVAQAAAMIGETNLDLLEATNILASDISGKYSNPHELTQSDAMSLHFAGRQRMLGHRMAKEVCGIATGATGYGTADALKQTVDLYDISLRALRDGMPNAGINPPPNEVIRSELSSVDDVWQANVLALTGFAASEKPSPDNVVRVSNLSSELMLDMDNVVTLYMLANPGQNHVFTTPLEAYAQNELSKWLENPELIAAIKAQNASHEGLSQSDIDGLDLKWRAEADAGGGALISEVLGGPVSEWLRRKQAETADFVTEVFAMDNRGLNVAQNVETSDYWQGDEAKWKQTYGNGSGQIHISEVEYDDSTGVYQSQVSMPVRDPATGDMIGAITFGINVQSLL